MTRFTLRDVFWLTLVVGMGVALWLERGRVSMAEREAGSFRDQCGELKMEVGLLHNLLAEAGYEADFSNGGSRLRPVGQP